LVQRLIAADSAIAEGNTLLIEHRAIAGLSVGEAGSLQLPALTDAVAHIRTSGLITRPEFRAELNWRRPTGQEIVGATRTGAWLKIGDEWRRIPDALFDISESVDRLNKTSGDDFAARLRSIATLREALPPTAASSNVQTSGLLSEMTIAIADAFSLDLTGEGAGAKLIPILHRAGGDPDAPLLPAGQQASFAEDQFNRFNTARPVYTLGNGWYVVLAPPLRRALAEVRRVQDASWATKRALIASPRSFLRQVLEADVEDTVLETVFRETTAYADRVVGLGLWSARVLPWIKIGGSDWFGPETDSNSEQAKRGSSRESSGGIIVGDQTIALTPEEAESLRERVEDAMGAARATVPLTHQETTVQVAATYETLAALQALEASRTRGTEKPQKDTSALPQVLVIRPNEERVEVEGAFAARPSIPLASPVGLATTLKQHQVDGLLWMQKAWTIGRPGVLLADDMGLGKTIQSLAFLAWLKAGMVEQRVARAPILIVAPTGLLQNWRAEHDRHLVAPGLGHCVEAYGRSLGAMKSIASDGRPALNTDLLKGADWVITTYETLRDYDRDFGSIRFAVILFDEAQKIKTPSVRVTDAAKAMNAEFRIALTGTPIENRLADLWCITDTIHPAYLGDLKRFSAQYERTPDLDRLAALKASLDRWQGGRPPIFLRRLKEDELPDLPSRNEQVREMVMPVGQLSAYEKAITEARRDRRPGAVLEALLHLRSLSLHPAGQIECSDQEFIRGSARMILAFEALDMVAERAERALVFLDDLEMQGRLVGVIQRRYGLSTTPMVINGRVDGISRQARVDRFQSNTEGFDVMVLSPRAGGVGLTLTSANHVIHLSRWWNPAVEDQCTGRVHRIGQGRSVYVHVPIAKLPDGRASFDQNLHALLQRKRKLMKEALMPPAATEADRNELWQATVA